MGIVLTLWLQAVLIEAMMKPAICESEIRVKVKRHKRSNLSIGFIYLVSSMHDRTSSLKQILHPSRCDRQRGADIDSTDIKPPDAALKKRPR